MTAKMLHIDSKGKILFEKTYKDLTVAHIKIISDTEIVLINKKDENLEIIDLETHKSILVPLHLTIGRTGIVGLLVFPETKYIAVIERKASMGSKV